MGMSKPDQNNFSKSFNNIKLFCIPNEGISTNLVQEKDCCKVLKVNSVNTATASINQTGIYALESICYGCNDCLQGNQLSYKYKNNREWLSIILLIK